MNWNEKRRQRRHRKPNDSEKESSFAISDDSTIRKTEEEEAKLQKRALRFSKTPDTRDFGFVSRGEDDRLQKSASDRQKYFKDIIRDFVDYCGRTESYKLSEELKRMVEEVDKRELQEPAKSIDSILSSLRKLREAMVALKPDVLTKKVYLFSIRLAASAGYYQTYVPAIYFLLREDAAKLLSVPETKEVSTLLVLHLAHFAGNNTKAFEWYFKQFDSAPDSRLKAILASWVSGDYYTWIKLYNGEQDNARARIMRFGVDKMITNMTRSIDKSYFNLDRSFLQELLPNGTQLDSLHKYGVRWAIDNDNVVIKSRNKVKKST